MGLAVQESSVSLWVHARTLWTAPVNLQRLRAFQAVAHTGTVTQASERLGLTQPAVSRLIGELERELGLSLFARNRNRLILTPEGSRFLHEAGRALAAVDEVVEIARDIRTLKGAAIRVLTHAMTAIGILPEIVDRLMRRHPDVRVTIEVKDIRDIPDWIAHGSFDVGIAYTALDDLRTDNEPLGIFQGRLVMPEGHRLARRKSLTFRDLAQERMVLPPVGNPDRTRIGAAFAAEGLVMRSAVDTAAAFSACQLVARGLGFAIVDPLTARVAAPLGLVSRPIAPTVAFPVTCFFPRGRPRSQLVVEFLSAARDVVNSAIEPAADRVPAKRHTRPVGRTARGA